MKLSRIVEALNAEILTKAPGFETVEADHAVAGDLMSEVLVVDEEGILIITALTSDQVARTADIVGAEGIIIVGGKKPQKKMIELAEESEITVLSVKHRLFETCCLIGKLLEEPE